MNEKKIKGLLSTPAYKRYKSFVTTVADREYLWLMTDKNSTTNEGTSLCSAIYVWPEKVFADFCFDNNQAKKIEVHSFLKNIRANVYHQYEIARVFYNGKDDCSVSIEKLAEDIQAELDLVE